MKLEQQMKERIRLQGKAKSTFETYWHWCGKFLRFLRDQNGGQWVHPATVGEKAAEAWLTHLAVREHVAKETQNLALQSICYLYKHVLGRPLVGVSALRSKRPQRLRPVIAVSQVAALFDELSGIPLLVSQMMYGCSGLRIGDVMALRIKDLSFERGQILVRSTKGDKDRYVGFPESLHDDVRRQVESMRTLHRWDLDNNPNGVSLPGAFRRKSPRAGSQFAWYFLFCSDVLSRDPDGENILCRHHRDASHIGREIKQASERARIDKRVTSHVLRHSYATHAHEMGVSMRTLQQLLGHSDIRTTELYVHADMHGATASKSPLEQALALTRPKSQPLRVINHQRKRIG